jgi:signal transduction histidine kinase
VTDNIRFLKDAFDELTRVAEAYEAVVDRLARGEGVDEELARVESLTQELDLPFLREEVPAAIVQSLEGLDRVARIVSAMKGFTHPGSTDKTLVDVNQVITDSMTVSRNEWKYVAALTTDLAPDLPLISGYPAELHQVVLNLIVNAAHAVQEASAPGEASGQIEVSTRAVENGVEVTIHDSGGGVPEAIRGRIFDPFFTTKDVGKGTGQGLAIAHAIVTEMHGGELLLDATDTPGATFRMRLPLRQPTRQAVAA